MKLPPININKDKLLQLDREMQPNASEALRALPDSVGGETPKSLQSYRTIIKSVFTEATGKSTQLYAAAGWIHVTISLQTAGPVALGTDADVAPVLSGKGVVLDPDDDPISVYCPKGTRIYYASETVNRLDLVIQPVPWLEQMDLDMIQAQRSLGDVFRAVGNTIVDAITNRREAANRRNAEKATNGVIVPQLPPGVGLLTPFRLPGKGR